MEKTNLSDETNNYEITIHELFSSKVILSATSAEDAAEQAIELYKRVCSDDELFEELFYDIQSILIPINLEQQVSRIDYDDDNYEQTEL